MDSYIFVQKRQCEAQVYEQTHNKGTENIDSEHLDMCMRMNMRPIQSISKPLDKEGDRDKRGKKSS